MVKGGNITNACAQCGKVFTHYGDRHFCSQSCYWENRRVPYDARQMARKKYRETHKAEIAEKRRNDPRIAQAKKDWAAQHPDAVRQSARNHLSRRRAELLAAYGGRCACCDEAEPTFLTLDHIGGGGAAHRRELKTRGAQVLRVVRQLGYPRDTYQLLCWNCQYGVLQKGGCPHRRVPIPDTAPPS